MGGSFSYNFFINKTYSLHKVNFRAERNSGAYFFVCLVETFDVTHTCTSKKSSPCDITFFQKSWTKSCTKLSLSYFQNMPIYYSSGKFKISIRFFWEYCYAIVFVYDISWPTEWCLSMTRTWTKFFQPGIWLTVFMKPFFQGIFFPFMKIYIATFHTQGPGN